MTISVKNLFVHNVLRNKINGSVKNEIGACYTEHAFTYY